MFHLGDIVKLHHVTYGMRGTFVYEGEIVNIDTNKVPPQFLVKPTDGWKGGPHWRSSIGLILVRSAITPVVNRLTDEAWNRAMRGI